MKVPSLLLKSFLPLILSAFLFTACEKEAGEGGSSSVRGQVKLQNYNGNYSMLNYEANAADEWVYIIYGDNIAYGDRQRTNYEGKYEFKYLREGNYKVYVYSNDSTKTSKTGDTVVVRDVEITKRKQVVDAPLITIFK